MKIYKALLSLTAVILFTAVNISAQKPGFITIEGQLKGFNNQVNIEEMSEYQYLLPPTGERLVVADTSGKFSIKFKADAPNYYRLGRNALYLSPGDHLKVFIDYGDPRKATFEGTGAAANTFLKDTPFPKGGSFIEAGNQVKATIEETIAAIEKQAAARMEALAAVKDVSPEFRRLEAARVKADVINSLKSGEFYSVYKLKLKDDAAKVFAAQYKQAILPKLAGYSKDFVDPTLMKLVVYRDVADDLITQGGDPAAIARIKDYYTTSNLVSEMQKISDKTALALYRPKVAAINTAGYREAAGKMLNSLMAFGKGDPAADFVAVNSNGEKVRLSSLKGKVIYVDLWATWCGPCMQEMPSYEKLKTKYKDNPDVVFVSLSIDDDQTKWKASLAGRKAEGAQWLINRTSLKAYNIVGIPRSLLIDREFKMADMAAPLPSAPAASKKIDDLLK